jgi:hypothetical protein
VLVPKEKDCTYKAHELVTRVDCRQPRVAGREHQPARSPTYALEVVNRQRSVGEVVAENCGLSARKRP